MSLKRKTIKLSLLTFLTIIGGFLFHIFLGRTFGASWQVDCFFVALTLFSWLGIFNNFFTSLYIPVFNEIKKHSLKDSFIFLDVVLKWIVLVAVVIIALVLYSDRWIINMLAPGFGLREVILTEEMAHIVVFALLFYSISNTVVLTLNALYYYSVPVLFDLFDPLLNIFALFLLVPKIGIKGLAISILISNLLKSSCLLIYLYNKAGWRPTVHFYHHYLPELVNKSSKMTVNSFIWSLKDIITRNIASRFGEGSIAVFSYAEKFINILIQVAINPVVRVFYSRVSELISLSKWDRVQNILKDTIRINFVLSLFACAGSELFLRSFLKLFLSGSRFTSGSIDMVCTLFNLMLIYFVILSFELYLSRIIFSVKRVGAVAINYSLGVAVLFITIWGLSRRYGISAIPIGIILSEAVVCVMYYILVRKYIQIDFVSIFAQSSKTVLLAAIFFFVGLVFKNSVNSNFIMLFVVLPVWSVLCIIMSKVVLKEEVSILVSK
ncbi:hypothetical protein EPO66_00765 [bacterium]|nr:MAG: hypothetical protein EPO66_00765 [bacterium]